MIVKQVKRFYVAVSNSKMYIGLYDPHTGVGGPWGLPQGTEIGCCYFCSIYFALKNPIGNSIWISAICLVYAE